jgi:hypothetical protein
MDAQVNGMVTVWLLFIYYCWTVVVAVTTHAMHGVCVCAACVCAPMLEQDANLLFFYLLCKVRPE